MNHSTSLTPAAMFAIMLALSVPASHAQGSGLKEADIIAGGAARSALTDIIMTSPPPETLDDSDSDLVRAGWRTPDDKGELTLFSNGTFSLSRSKDGEVAWDDGTFGADGSVLVLKASSVGGGVEWRYRLVEFGVVPRRFGLRLETKGAAGSPPAALYDALNRHFLPVAKTVSIARGSIELLPIGWSRQGSLAYIAKSFQNNGRGADQYALVIFDAVEDVVVYEHVVVPEDRPVIYELELDAFRYVWAHGTADYCGKLQAMGIVPYRDSGMPASRAPSGAFPLSSLGVSYTATVTLTPPAGSDPVPFSVRRTMTVRAQSAAKGSKTVTTLKDRRVRDASVYGWMQSPFEERIAVIVETQVYERDWESPPDLDSSSKPKPEGPETPYDAILGYFLTGCNLKVGFKK